MITVLKSKKESQKLLKKLAELVKSPVFLGVLVTFGFVFLSTIYYQMLYKNKTERFLSSKLSQSVFAVVEFLDAKILDQRFKLRGQAPITDKVALLTVDDRSIEELGRWPWSREKIDHIVNEMMKYGASSIGFDIIFSEPQVDQVQTSLARIEQEAGELSAQTIKIINEEKEKANIDEKFANTVDKFKESLVLGAFYDNPIENSSPYQDYCLNEAFSAHNADQFVKLHTNISVDDVFDPFVDLNFSSIFTSIFEALEKGATDVYLEKVFKKKSVLELNERELKKLQFVINTERNKYCSRWLTTQDEYLPQLKGEYLKVFAESPLLKDLPIDKAIAKFKKVVLPLPLPNAEMWTINTNSIQSKAEYTGSFNAHQDPDGTVRRTFLFFRTGNKIGTSYVPSLALETYLRSTGYRADVEINIDPKNPKQKMITRFQIVNPKKEPEELIATVPVDQEGALAINYAGKKNTYPYLPAKELFTTGDEMEITVSGFDSVTGRWGEATRKVKKAEFIKDRAFIFGASAMAVYDLRVTPMDPNFPGPEIHLNVLANLHDRSFIRINPNERSVMIVALLIAGVLFSLAISYLSAIYSFALTAVTLLSVGVFDFYLFKQGFLLTSILPALLIISLFIFLFTYKYLTEERKKKQLRSTFSKYVSPAIVDEILKDPANIELGGRKQRMTVFFSDLRNFTTISEKLQATELSDVLNLYLTPMTNLVFKYKGTLDKYIGDAVMAFFGAPIGYPDNAAFACRCALASIAELDNIRKTIDTKFPGKNIPIEIGIGINTADVSVGNMGSDIVRSYTVMGDGVNLASRLEGITKEYSVKIVISEFTHAEIGTQFTCRELDNVRVKGKLKPVKIFELISEGAPKEAAVSQLLDCYNQGLAMFNAKDFGAAKSFFTKGLEFNADDGPCQLYIERCDYYLENPPPADWDGVTVMKTK